MPMMDYYKPMTYEEYLRLRELDEKLCKLMQTDEGKRLYREWVQTLKKENEESKSTTHP